MRCDWQGPTKITVGDQVHLVCDIALANPETAHLISKDPYLLRLLEVRSLPTGQTLLVVTSYQVGNNSTEGVTLENQGQVLPFENLPFSVQSVLKDPNDNKPKGPLATGPLSYGWPFWTLLASLLVATLVIGLAWILRWFKRRRWLQVLKGLETGRDPLQDFFLESRRAEQVGSLDDFRSAFFNYVSRVLRIPMRNLKPRQRLVMLSKTSIEEDLRLQLAQLLRELDRAERLEDVVHRCRQVSERLGRQ